MDVSAAIPDWLELGGALALIFTACAGASAIVWRFGPVRWLRSKIADEVVDRVADVVHSALDPIAEKVAGIEAAIAPTNGDRSSISDRLDKVKRTGLAVKADLAAHRADETAERERRQAEVDARMDGFAAYLATGQSEIKLGVAAIAESRPPLPAEVHVTVETSEPTQ